MDTNGSGVAAATTSAATGDLEIGDIDLSPEAIAQAQAKPMALATPDWRDIEKQDEADFLTIMPRMQWMLVKKEEKRSRSAILKTTEISSPFGIVLAIGPGFTHDVTVGDRIHFVEGVALHKDLVENTDWAKKYLWVHENKYLGRPRRPDGSEAKLAEHPVKSLDPSLSRLFDDGTVRSMTPEDRQRYDNMARDGKELAARYGQDVRSGSLGQGSTPVKG